MKCGLSRRSIVRIPKVMVSRQELKVRLENGTPD